MLEPAEALARLEDGNRRFVAGRLEQAAAPTASRRAELAAGQAPFAVILGCADSRVPPELIFDHGPGELFVIRVAGNVVSPPELGSVEFAIAALDTRLVVVLGHSGCGAVSAAIRDPSEAPDAGATPGLHALVEQVRAGLGASANGELDQAVRANVRVAVAALRRNSPLLGRLAEEGTLRIVGATYTLDSGAVEFLDGPSEGAGRGERR